MATFAVVSTLLLTAHNVVMKVLRQMQKHIFPYKQDTGEMLGSCSGVVEDSSLPGCTCHVNW